MTPEGCYPEKCFFDTPPLWVVDAPCHDDSSSTIKVSYDPFVNIGGTYDLYPPPGVGLTAPYHHSPLDHSSVEMGGDGLRGSSSKMFQ